MHLLLFSKGYALWPLTSEVMLDFNNLLIRKVIILLLKDFDLDNCFQNSSSINRKLRTIKSTKSLFLLQLFEEKSIPIHGLDLFLFSRSYFYTSSLPFVLLRHSFVLLAFITHHAKFITQHWLKRERERERKRERERERESERERERERER